MTAPRFLGYILFFMALIQAGIYGYAHGATWLGVQLMALGW